MDDLITKIKALAAESDKTTASLETSLSDMNKAFEELLMLNNQLFQFIEHKGLVDEFFSFINMPHQPEHSKKRKGFSRSISKSLRGQKRGD